MSRDQPLAAFLGTDTAWLLEITKEDGSPADLDNDVTAIDARFANCVGEAAVFTLSIGNGITKLTQSGPTLGQARMVVTSAQLALFSEAGEKSWQVKSTNNLGEVKMSIKPSPFFVLEEINT